jgi:purine-nucleoside phosphorylase
MQIRRPMLARLSYRPSRSERLPATLIVCAWEPEVASLRRWLTTSDGRRRARAVHVAAAGIGAIDAALGTARLIAAVRPRRVLFVGTAGVYPGARGRLPAIDAAVVVSRATLVSTAALRDEGYLPAPVSTEVVSDRTLVAQLSLSPSPPIGAACPLGITKSAALARRIVRATAAAVENLELFAVARAAALAGLPFAAVVGIANRVGPHAHAEWKAHHRSASAAACAVVTTWTTDRPAA